MKDLLMFPFGGNAREALLAIQAQNKVQKRWNVLGFIDDDKDNFKKDCCGVKVLGGRNIFDVFPSAYVLAVPGSPDNFLKRERIITSLEMPLVRYATVVDPSARIAPDAKVGKNTVVMANVVISCSVEIGNHCIVLPNTVISHDSCVGDYSLIGSNVSISGACKIGRNCYIGSGTRIKNNLTIASKSLVGLGSCVVKDVPGNMVVAGNPAQNLKKIEEKY